MLIKKILCPTDRSENAKTGMAYALSLGREHKAELVFLSCHPISMAKNGVLPT